jgi:LPXTG-motif cell wall-anchored protein
MAELAKGGYAINVHKSAAEVSTYVSCGDIMAMAMGGSMGGQTMPATGNGDQTLLLGGLALLALLLSGAGLHLARRRA